MGLFNIFKNKKQSEEVQINNENKKFGDAIVIKNRELENDMIEKALFLLAQQNLINPTTPDKVIAEFGYVLKLENRGIEVLYKIQVEGKLFYIAIQQGTLKLIDITEAQYISVIQQMKEMWNFVSEEEVENKQTLRRQKNNEFIKSQGIICHENLPLIESSEQVTVKPLEKICARAIMCFIVIQIACDINNDNYEESINFFKPILDKYDGYKYLNSKEKRIVDGTYTKQDAIDMDWAYECLWSLLYALSFVDDISDGGQLCDCDYVINLFREWPTIEEFAQKSKLRNTEEILDALDLYFRYHWAVVEKQVNPNANIGNLNSSNVAERRRGLEWLISDEEDWYDISLDT